MLAEKCLKNDKIVLYYEYYRVIIVLVGMPRSYRGILFIIEELS